VDWHRFTGARRNRSKKTEREDEVTRPQFLKKLEALLTDAERSRMFGSIEIEFKNGEAVFMRKTTTERLGMENNSDDHSRNR
jgi:hypothetical protein